MSYKGPSALRVDSGFSTTSRGSRSYCRKCNEETFKIHGVCCHCDTGGVEMGKIKMHFNGKQRGVV